jgi:hypothetical protein
MQLHHVQDVLKQEAEAPYASDADVEGHRRRYTNMTRLALYGEETMKKMAEDDMKRAQAAKDAAASPRA